MSNLYAIRSRYLEDGIIFSFSGEVSQSIIAGIAENLEKKMESFKVKSAVTNRIFSVFIEQMQNIMKYSIDISDREELSPNIGISVIGFDRGLDKYYISSGNLIKSEQAGAISDKIEKVNSLKRDELKRYYREVRRSGVDKHKDGAGLGFLEMAKKSSEPIEFLFERVDSKHTFFTLKTTI